MRKNEILNFVFYTAAWTFYLKVIDLIISFKFTVEKIEGKSVRNCMLCLAFYATFFVVVSLAYKNQNCNYQSWLTLTWETANGKCFQFWYLTCAKSFFDYIQYPEMYIHERKLFWHHVGFLIIAVGALETPHSVGSLILAMVSAEIGGAVYNILCLNPTKILAYTNFIVMVGSNAVAYYFCYIGNIRTEDKLRNLFGSLIDKISIIFVILRQCVAFNEIQRISQRKSAEIRKGKRTQIFTTMRNED